ncbi:MOSC domain-containing protein [Cellulomonas carbonis]|uniref:MOSC domain-containing protein n=1 Tax=Cellulomonas carbonis TaxID=1386092 RepID=UPI0005BCD76B|nr:MOSC domain-containing protein [Cellulomonas carbonis]
MAVALDDGHRFSKPTAESIRLIEGWGVEGDAHAGPTVRHRFRVAKDPTAPNLRQVHLIHAELLEDIGHAGHHVVPGGLGENVTTAGLDLLALPEGAVLRLGADAAVRVTGLRNPCAQIDGLSPGLMRRLVRRSADGSVERLAGVMAVVVAGGVVRPGDGIAVELPDGQHEPLRPV